MSVIICKLNNYNDLSNYSNKTVKKPIQIEALTGIQFQNSAGIQPIQSEKIKALLPGYNRKITSLFSKIITDQDSQIREAKADTIKLEEKNGQLDYALYKSKEKKSEYSIESQYSIIESQRFQRRYAKITKNIKSFFNDIENPAFSKRDIKIIKQAAPSRIDRIQKDESKTNETDWPLWAIFICKIKNTVEGIFEFIGLRNLLDWIPNELDNVIGGGLSFHGLAEGITLTTESSKIGDEEGKSLAIQQTGRNLMTFLACTLDWVKDLGLKVLTATTAAVVIPILVPVIFLIVMSGTICKHNDNLNKISKFEKEINSLAENKFLPPELKIKQIAKLLKSKIAILDSKFEIEKKLKDIEKNNPNLSKEEKIKLLNKEDTNALLTKLKRFERRSGLANLDLSSIQEDIDKTLKNPNDPENLVKTCKILEKITESIDLKKMENRGNIVVVLFQMLGICLLFASLPLLAILSGVISSVIAIVLLSYKLIINKPKINSKDMRDSHRVTAAAAEALV